MSAAVYAQLLAEFQQGAVDAKGKLFRLKILSPGNFSMGVPGMPDTYDRKTHEFIAGLSLPFDSSTDDPEASTEAVAVMARASHEHQKWLPTKKEIDRLQHLFATAGAVLPDALKTQITPYHHHLMDENQAAWWVALLAFRQQLTVYSPDGQYLQSQIIMNPWEDSARAIESLKLNWHSNENWPTPAGNQSAGQRKRPGRKKADYTTVQREAQLAADWKRAFDDGTYKTDFAKDNGLKVKDLNAILARVRMRKQ